MNPSSGLITITESQLSQLETQVREGLSSFMTVGQALVEIREGKGYRLRDFKTFEDYCERTFGFSVRHGQRMLAAADTGKKVQAATGEVPANESVARVLTPVADDPVVLKKVQARLEKKRLSIATAPAEKIAEVVAAVTGKPAPGQAKTNGNNGHGEPKAKAAPAPAALPVVSDICPHCHVAPKNYVRSEKRGKGYACGACGKPVLINVILAEPVKSATCPTCKAAIGPGDVTFCENCGGVL